jgi:predicted PurR-regulated permease PerM
MTPAERNRVIARAVSMSIAGIAAAWMVYQVRQVLLMLYISSLLAIGLSPAVRRIERSLLRFRRIRIPRWLAILALYVAFLLAVALVIALMLPPLAGQIRQLAQDLPGHVDRLQQTVLERGWLDHQWSWKDLVANLPAPGAAISSVLGAMQGVIGVFGAVVTVLILPFYLLLESASIRATFLRLAKPENRGRADRIARAVTVKVGAWLGGQFLLAAIIGTSATVGFWLIGVPYFYVLGVIAAVGEMIPVVGPILAAVPAILLGWTVSPQTALIVLAYCWAQQFVENNLLVPRIMERQVGVSPVTIMVALLIGSSLLGFVGAILAVPSAAIVQVIVQEHLARDDGDPADVGASADEGEPAAE